MRFNPQSFKDKLNRLSKKVTKPSFFALHNSATPSKFSFSISSSSTSFPSTTSMVWSFKLKVGGLLGLKITCSFYEN